MLSVIKELFTQLNDKNISYCHWKSNAALDRTITGLNDIDLLIDRSNYNVFIAIIAKLGFKRVQVPDFKDYSGIDSYIANSSIEGILVHLHIHYQLVFGEQLIKGYHLPAEKRILENSVLSDENIRITNPNDEIVLLFLRVFLKFNTIELIKKIIKRRTSYFPNHIIKEFEYLRKRINFPDVLTSYLSDFSILSNKEIERCIQDIDKFSLREILRFRRKIKIDLKPYRRFKSFQKFLLRIFHYAQMKVLTSRYYKRRSKKKLETGGFSIAFLGIDGAGKSTIINELNNWLSPQLNTKKYYLGSGDGNKIFLLHFMEFLFKIFTKRKKTEDVAKRHNKTNTNDKSTIKAIAKSLLIYAQVLHKKRALNNSRLNRNNGSIIIYDRFPQNKFRDYNDGPKCKNSNNFISQAIYSWEKKQYLGFEKSQPDLKVYLKITPELSIKRKLENDYNAMVIKENIFNDIIECDSESYLIIDASKPIDQVLLGIKSNIWSKL